MSNMSYCKFCNTLLDLQDCAYTLYDLGGNISDLDEEEQTAAHALIRLCCEIADSFGEECLEPIKCDQCDGFGTASTTEPVLDKYQPCGCVICTCENDVQCQGCGARHCGKHPIGEIPGPVYVSAESVEGLSAEQLAEILAAYIKPEIIGEALEKLENAPWELSEPVAADFPVKGKVHGPLGWIANTTNPEPVEVDAEASVPSDMDIDELSREWGLASATYPSKMMVRDFARALLARYK